MTIALKSFVTGGTDSSSPAIFTVANNASQIVGSTLGYQTVRIQDKANFASGIVVDANVERIDLSGNLVNYKFLVKSATGLEIQHTDGTVVATISTINQDVKIVFADGFGTLHQEDATTFTLNTVALAIDDNSEPAATPDLAGHALIDTTLTTVSYTDGTVNLPADSAGTSKSFVTGGTSGGTAAIFTVADKNVKVLGDTGNNELVRIQAGVTDVTLDANIERVELSAALATYKFVAVAGTGLQIQNVTDSAVVATIPSINQDVKIAFTDGSATLAQTGATAFTLNTVTLAVSPATAATPDLTGHALVTTTGERSALGLHVTSATSAADITTVFSEYAPTSGTSNTAATVVADDMDPDQLDAVAAEADQIKAGGITGVMALTDAQSSSELTALFSKDDLTPDATFVGTIPQTGTVDVNAASQIAVLADNFDKIAPLGISGSIGFTGAQFLTLEDNIAGRTDATLSVVEDDTLTATVLIAMNTKSDNLVTATVVHTVEGGAADIKTVTDAMDSSGNKILLDGLTTLNLTDAVTESMFDATIFTQADVTINLFNDNNTLTIGNDSVVGAGNVLQINGGGLTGTNRLVFDGSAETATVGSFNVTGGAGTDSIVGGDGSDTITGGLGDDTITGSGGSDDITVDAGTDTITDFDVTADTLNISAASATAKVTTNVTADYSTAAVTNTGTLDITISAGSNTTTGSTGADSITGSAGTDVIDGDAGNDTISGGLDADTITGGTGSDSITAGAGTDTITDFKVGEDTLTISALATAKVTADVTADYSTAVTNAGILDITIASADLTITGSTGADSITGSAGTDSILGGEGSDTIDGGDGDDDITGGSGDDTITGGAGSDAITVDFGTDTINNFDVDEDTLDISADATAIVTTPDADTDYSAVTTNAGILDITIAAGSNTTTGSSGADIITGSAGTDSIVGDTGNDTIAGGADDDTLVGGAGSDDFKADGGTDTINDFTVGEDTLVISAGATAIVTAPAVGDTYDAVNNAGTLVINGDAGSSTITGSSGDDSITGGAGTDSIVGGAGVDTIDGGLDNDTITGSGGSDTFNVTGGTDTITDWTAGEDTLNISSGATAKIVLANASTAVTYAEITAGQNAGTLFIDASVGSSTITGSSGNDSIVGSTGDDSITGGEGSDTIVSGAGSDTIDGGVGDDTIVIEHTGAIITINGFDNGDSLVFPVGANFNIVNFDGTDEQITLTMNDPVDDIETTIIFTGLSSTDDGNVYNVPSFNATFGNVIPV